MALTRRNRVRAYSDNEGQSLLRSGRRRSRQHSRTLISPRSQSRPSTTLRYLCNALAVIIALGVISSLLFIAHLLDRIDNIEQGKVPPISIDQNGPSLQSKIEEIQRGEVPPININQNGPAPQIKTDAKIPIDAVTPKTDDDAARTALKEEVSKLHRPDFLMIGVVKSGSTSLYHYLNHHPAITGVVAEYLLPAAVRRNISNILLFQRKSRFLRRKGERPQSVVDSYPDQDPEIEGNLKGINRRSVSRMTKPIIDQKEVRFFDRFWFQNVERIAGNDSLLSWKWYLGVFDQERGDEVLRGEASPTYFVSGEYTADKIKEWLPEVKLILTLRNPIERFVSHLKMLKTMRETAKTMATPKSMPRKPTRTLADGVKAVDRDDSVQIPGIDADFKRGANGQRMPPMSKRAVMRRICDLSIYQIILISAANDAESRAFYLDLWSLGQETSDVLNRLLEVGKYDEAMPAWLDRFDEDHFFFRDSGELYGNTVQMMQDLERYLGVDPLGAGKWANITSKVYNVKLQRGSGFFHKAEDGDEVEHWDITEEKDTEIPHVTEKRTLQSQEVIGLLRDYYRPHNLNLSRQIGGKRYKGWDY